MKKVVFGILMVLLLTGALFAGGGNESADDSKITLRLAWLGDGQDKRKLDETIDIYEERTGVTVETVYIPGTWAEYFTKIQTMVAGGDRIDAAYVAIEGFQMFVDMGLANSVDDFVLNNKAAVDELFADVPAGVAAPFTIDGKLYGFPTSYNNVVMHMNTARFEEAGVALPDENWTKEEFLEICEQLTYEKDGMKYYAITLPYENFTMEAWLQNNGVGFMTDDFKQSTINSPEAIEVFQLWQDLVHKYGYAPLPEANMDTIQQLADGVVAMGSWGRWPMFTYENNDFKDVALQYLPNFSRNQVQFGVDGVLVASSTTNYDAACDLALWMASDEFVEKFFTIGNIPARRSLAEKLVPIPGYPANNEIFYKDVDDAVAVHSPIAFAQTAAITEEAYSKIVVQGADVKTTLDDAAARMNAALAN